PRPALAAVAQSCADTRPRATVSGRLDRYAGGPEGCAAPRLGAMMRSPRRARSRGRPSRAPHPTSARRSTMAADGGPELVQLLTPEGERVHHPDYDVDLGADELRGIYRDLVLVRRVDTEATALQRQGELGLWAPLLGQEAAQVGSGRAL